ncbi:MAG: PorT family protein [Sediminibacterium sp.]|nr:PorT family protein [Sediminibacterium sp.]
MKQKLIAFFAAGMLLSSLQSFGQTSYLDVLLNGVNTNFNYGNANSSLKNYKKSVFGAQAGVSFQAGITPNFSLVPELYFMMKGGKLLANNPVTNNETTVRLYTAELPVLARFHLGRAYLNAGPAIAYDFGGNNKLANSSKAISFQNGTAGFKRFDASVQVGGGYEFPFKQKRVALDIRYCYGVTNISYDREIYNRSLIVSIHFSRAWKTNPLAKNKL